MTPDSALRSLRAPSDALPDSSRALLDAVTALSSDLDLHGVLTRIVESASALTGARYAALGVLGSGDGLVEFVTTGVSDAERARIGSPPHGRGILGLLISEPRPLRLHDLGEHPASYGFPDGHPPMTSFLGVPVLIRGTVFGNLYLTEKAGGQDFTDTDEDLVVALAQAAGLVIENARAYGLSERRRRWLEAAADLTDALQPPVDDDRALEQIATTARRLSGARAVVVMSADDDPVVRAVASDGPDRATNLDSAGLALESTGVATLAEPVEVPLGGPADPIAAVLPLRTRLADGGLLIAVFDGEHQRLRDLDDRELLVSFADHAALALDRARAVADREEHAVTQDRERIARDLHDVVIQRLFATGMQLRAAALRGGDDLTDRVEQSVSDLDMTIRDVRATIFGLQHDGTGSVRHEVRVLAQEYAEALGQAPVVRTVGPVDTAVDEALRSQLLPVLREALSNVAQHARATRVEVELVVDADELLLSVLDDGVGVGPAAPMAQHSGLRNARERAEALGGTLELSPRVPHGLMFRWRVPLGAPGVVSAPG
ncbi:MAG: GAF domain-containing protein [Nocardioides sp.]|nr:GAF domain-containing protein [Nocardioides sp.]